MRVVHLDDCPEFRAGDNSMLREILHPRHRDHPRGYSLARASIAPGNKTQSHRLTVTEAYFITSGRGIMHVDNETQAVSAGDTVCIPAMSIQFIENTGRESLEFLCIVEPAWQPECEQVIAEDPQEAVS